jgi:hypothetical protein
MAFAAIVEQLAGLRRKHVKVLLLHRRFSDRRDAGVLEERVLPRAKALGDQGELHGALCACGRPFVHAVPAA